MNSSKRSAWLALTPCALFAAALALGCGGADQDAARPQQTPTTLKGRPPANVVDTQYAAETDDNPAEPAGQIDSPVGSGTAQHARPATAPKSPTTARPPSTPKPPPERPPKPPPTKAQP